MTFSPAGRWPATLSDVVARVPLPEVLRPVVLDDVPEGWERQAFAPRRDGDVLDWLGFRPTAEDDAPLLPWRRPARWPDRLRLPAVGRRSGGRHRTPAGLRPV